MSLLRIEGLEQRYTDAYSAEEMVALQGVDFGIEEGEFVSILGPSGCGKTTLLNIVAGFIKPTAGAALLDGEPVAGPGPDRGVVFQSFALFPWKSVYDNITFGPKMRGVSKQQRDALAREYIELVGLTGFEQRYPHELSGGMQQRVGVARVLANEPRVMLMDEPFAALDAQTRMTMQEELTRIWEARRTTILFVTHDVDEAVFLSDRVVVLRPRPGRIHEIVDVDIPRPRSWQELTDDDTFRRRTRYVLDLIQSGSGKGGSSQGVGAATKDTSADGSAGGPAQP